MFKNNPFIVAEISGNHNGDLAMAFRLIEEAKHAGADAVKFQTFQPRDMAADALIKSGPWANGRTYRQLYEEIHTEWYWHAPLFEYARQIGLVPFSSPFSPHDVDNLETIGCPIYKIASPEIQYKDLIQAAARTGKPLIISTGMAAIGEIHNAWVYAVAAGASDITFLHCISAYPAKSADFNMETMRAMIQLGYKVGLSDHSREIIAPIMAVALGATVIEKHICLDRSLGGPDSKFSLEPSEFCKMVTAVREAAEARGVVQFGCREAEKDSYQYRRSLWFVRDMQPGQRVTEQDIAVLRPNYGIAPDQFSAIIGKRVKATVTANTPVSLENFDD